MAETKTRTCSCCGTEIQAVSLTLSKLGAAGNKVGKTVEVGGRLCEKCEAGGRKAELERLIQDKLHEYRQWAMVPRRYQGIGYDGFTATEAVEAAQAWAKGELKALCLTGDVGVGKSWLAAAAIEDMMRQRAASDAEADLDEAHDGAPRVVRPVRWVSVSALMNDLRRSFKDEERSTATKVVAGRGAIVLDDLDKVNPTDFGKEVVFSTIDTRLADDKPLLATTNLTPGELGSKLGKPVMSRIAGECLVVQMVGPDRRVQPVVRAA